MHGKNAGMDSLFCLRSGGDLVRATLIRAAAGSLAGYYRSFPVSRLAAGKGTY